jgi:hypothetical protein
MMDAAELEVAPEATEPNPDEEVAVLVPEAPEPFAYAKHQPVAVDGKVGYTFGFYRRTRGKGILQAQVIDAAGKPRFVPAEQVSLPAAGMSTHTVRRGSRIAGYLEALQRDGKLTIEIPEVGPTGGKTPYATASAQVYTLARKHNLKVKVHKEGNTLQVTRVDTQE